MTKRQEKIRALMETASCDELLQNADVQKEIKSQEGRRAVKYLKELSTSECSQWASAYVRRLSALVHCDEVLTLNRAEAVARAEGRRGEIEPALEDAMADLWCILEMHRSASAQFKGLCVDRAFRFRP